ncbi:transporter substrate-binding domain-containing protein [Streptococcus henryi]|uniref:transporter substrate-binding domain-containing protein n=1 Tax=Streptococcus henryi TaxID=439219 RepID=UPI000362DDD0|nr:transporter substrate-binding domain-containing protein [Streptococcus henryi]
MKFRKVLLGAATILGAVTLAACSSGSKTEKTSSDKWETYQTNKSITIGFDNTFVPMGFENESGQNVGFDIELAEAVFAEYDIKVKWQPINWDMKETELNNETIDLIWNGYSVTKERQEKVLFTDSYMVNEQVLVTKKSSNITAVDGMSGKVLGAQAGSAGYSMFEANSEILKDIVSGNDATQYSTFTEALIDLDNGRIDGLLIDRVYANYYLTEEGILDDYNIIDAGYETDAFAAGARKSDTTLVEKINEAFKVLYEKGKFQEISEKWFGEDVATENVK